MTDIEAAMTAAIGLALAIIIAEIATGAISTATAWAQRKLGNDNG